MDRTAAEVTGSESIGTFVDRLVTRPPLADLDVGKLPWDDDEFSIRMLREHLDQTHDRASRRAATIDAHVAWILGHVLSGAPGRVLDLGCGPGLYTERLAELGCVCLGVDIAPASIDRARRVAVERGLDCTYVLGDIRAVDLGTDHDLAMLLFGEFNTFTREDAAKLLFRAAAAVRPGGTVLLEVHSLDFVVEDGTTSAGWYTSPPGLFSGRPHLVLTEHAWDESNATSTTRYHVVDDHGAVVEHSEALRGYTVDEYLDVLRSAGLERETVVDVGAFADPTMIVLTARRPDHPAGPVEQA